MRGVSDPGSDRPTKWVKEKVFCIIIPKETVSPVIIFPYKNAKV